MKKFISLVIVALCFCACDDEVEVKEYQKQCDSEESCKKECDEGNGAACIRLILAFSYRLSPGQQITYAQKSCDLHYAVGCFELADSYRYKYGVDFAKEHYQKALKMLQKSCEQNHNGAACSRIASMYDYGTFLEEDKNKAKIYYEKACDKNDGRSCNSLGYLYDKGEGVTQDFEKALSYYEKACELDAYQCHLVGDLYLKDKKYNVAISFYEKGCDKNDGRSCNSLGYLYDKGEGVTQDFEKAFNYYKKGYEKGCDKNDYGSCKLLGDLYYKGEGVTQDFDKAFNYHKKGCDNAIGRDMSYRCNWVVGNFYFEKKKYNEAKYFMEKSCESDCYNEGWESAKNKDYIKARLYYEIACDKGSAAGCNNLGVLYDNGQGVAKNTAKAKTFYEKSCGMGSTMVCQNVGYDYYNAREFAKAKAAFEKGCGANLADSCSFLGVLYEFGEGVRQDLSTAKSYYGKGCDGGSQRGCDGYKKLNQRGVR